VARDSKDAAKAESQTSSEMAKSDLSKAELAKQEIDHDLIRALAKLLDETGLTEIEFERGGQRVRVARQAQTAVAVASAVRATTIEPSPLPAGTGTVDPAGAVTLASSRPAPRHLCPICLARWDRIATPAGNTPVTALRPGTLVWTLDAGGRRAAAPVLVVGHTPAPIGHQVVHLVLVDGRSVDVSPGHPLPDGRPLGDLRPGDPVDGSSVASAELRRYDGSDTWDLLPAGATHVYWADGVPLRSTL